MAKICIDPGHGGKDPGALGFNRKEKDDVLKLGLAVQKLLKEQGVSVIMTRSSDIDITIANRTALANKEKCDYFISLHRDAFSNQTASGSGMYIYSKASADTEKKAQIIYDAVLKASGFKKRGLVKGAANYTDYGVNKQTNMSACLLELGFITTKSDNELFDKNFDSIALALAKSLCSVVGVTYKVVSTTPTTSVKPTTARPSPDIKAWQTAAIKDGFNFPKFGPDGYWGSESESVAQKAICKKYLIYKYKNLTKIIQRAVGVTADGKFGNDTRAAVIKFQKLHRLSPDGVVGLATWKQILSV